MQTKINAPIVETTTWSLLRILFNDAAYHHMVYGVALRNGLGKTFTAKRYCEESKNALYIECTPSATLVSILSHIAMQLRLAATPPSLTLNEQVAFALMDNEASERLLILDDAEQLHEPVFIALATFLQQISGKCGFVLMGNDDLRMRILDGVRLNKNGYEGIYGLLGRRFITLNGLGGKDVLRVCKINGIADAEKIDTILATCADNLKLVMEHIGHLKAQDNT